MAFAFKHFTYFLFCSKCTVNIKNLEDALTYIYASASLNCFVEILNSTYNHSIFISV